MELERNIIATNIMIEKTFYKNKGMTLVEIVVVVAIFGLIMLAVFELGSSIFSFNRVAQDNLFAQSSARKVLKVMISELRSVSPSSLGAYPISSVGTSTITFFSNIDTDDYKERIRYFVQGNSLMKGVIKPSGNPLVYNNVDEEVSLLIDYFANGSTPMFEYFDEDYSGTSTPLVDPVQATSVRLVKIYIVIDKDANKNPGPIFVTSQVSLRNLKNNL